MAGLNPGADLGTSLHAGKRGPSTSGLRANRAWEAAGLTRIGLHEARHTPASYLLAAGVDFKRISTYMGHSSVASTISGPSTCGPRGSCSVPAG